MGINHMTNVLELNIGGTNYEAKATFAFMKESEKLGTYNEDSGKIEGGLENLLTALAQEDASALVNFWTAATAHYGKSKKPKQQEIEKAIEDAVENGVELEDLIKGAYKFMSNSGFFKRKVTTFWENFELIPTMGKTEDEKEQNQFMYDRMMKLKAQIEE